MVKEGKLVTPSTTENILEGITRRTVIEMARQEMDIPVIERPIDRTEIYLCDELFMTGTAAQITAVTHVDHRQVGCGEMGPVTARLRETFDQVVRGKRKEYSQWNVPVYAKS
jgi:branched-chain amino acid aminotransferase